MGLVAATLLSGHPSTQMWMSVSARRASALRATAPTPLGALCAPVPVGLPAAWTAPAAWVSWGLRALEGQRAGRRQAPGSSVCNPPSGLWAPLALGSLCLSVISGARFPSPLAFWLPIHQPLDVRLSGPQSATPLALRLYAHCSFLVLGLERPIAPPFCPRHAPSPQRRPPQLRPLPLGPSALLAHWAPASMPLQPLSLCPSSVHCFFWPPV